jgi:hypothetical protein
VRAGRKRKLGPRTEGRLCRFPAAKRAAFLAPIFGEARAIYIIQIGTDAVKIGISTDPSVRIKELQVGHEKSLRAVWVAWMREPDAVHAEKVIHRKLKATVNHARGECYFMATDTAIAAVQCILEDMECRYMTDDRVRDRLATLSAA